MKRESTLIGLKTYGGGQLDSLIATKPEIRTHDTEPVRAAVPIHRPRCRSSLL